MPIVVHSADIPRIQDSRHRLRDDGGVAGMARLGTKTVSVTWLTWARTTVLQTLRPQKGVQFLETKKVLCACVLFGITSAYARFNLATRLRSSARMENSMRLRLSILAGLIIL